MTGTLTWRDAHDDVITADSARPIPDHLAPSGYTGAHYYIEEDSGFRPGRPDEAPTFVLTYNYEDEGGDAEEVDLGRAWPDLDAAKAAAERYEQTGDAYAGEPGMWRRAANLEARFLPQDARDNTARPCIVIAGIQVYAYLDEETGTLHVSTHYDGAEAPAIAEDGSVPTRVSVGGQIVFDA
jgi:hypothetical protein